MAHFYGELQGSKGSATRIGTEKSGISAHIRGWNIGVEVKVFCKDGIDVVEVWKTYGSNGHNSPELLLSYTEEPNES